MKQIHTPWLILPVLLAGLLAMSLPAAAEELPVPALEEPGVISAAGADAGLPDNDALFAMYFEELSFGRPSAAAPMDTKGKCLSGMDKCLYDALRGKIQDVADGRSLSAEFALTAQDLGLKDRYTVGIGPEYDIQLDLNVADPGSVWQPPLLAAVAGLTSGLHIGQVHSYLLNDCPASFYWYDKSVGYVYSNRFNCNVEGCYDKYTGQLQGVNLTTFSLVFRVATDYAPGGAYAGTAINASAITRARAAVANARSCVTKYAGKTDYEKLKGYLNEINSLVYYNHSAASSGNTQVMGIDPWQLVSVFDGDPTTNVVCEGYSKAFQYLCDLSDADPATRFKRHVDSFCVSGVCGGGHMWNVVRIGWKSYLVDLTNCDAAAPGYSGNTAGYPDKLFLRGGSPSGNANRYIFAIPPEPGYLANTITYEYYDGSIASTVNQREVFGDALTLWTADYVLPLAGVPDNYWYYAEDDVFFLETPEELAGLIELVNTGGVELEGKTVILSSDMDMTGFSWTPPGTAAHPFNGTLDGGGHTVSGLSTALLGVVGPKGRVKDLAVPAALCSENRGVVEDCLAGGVLAGTNKGTMQNCLTSGSRVVTTNTGTVTNCFYRADAESDTLPGTTCQSDELLASGQTAWALQAGRTTQVWGQSLSGDPRPVLTAAPAKRVFRVAFYAGASLHHAAYANSGGTVALPVVTPVKEGYLFTRWAAGASASAGDFTAATPVTADVSIYAVMRELFGTSGGGPAVSTTFGTEKTADLSVFMDYAGTASPAGKFSYTVLSALRGSETVAAGTVATTEGDTLVIRATAPAGTYTLMVQAQEKAPQYSLFAAGTTPGTSPVSFPVTVQIDKAPARLTAPPQAVSPLAYTGQPLTLVSAGSAVGGEVYYSLDNLTFSPDLPTATDEGEYTVYYKVVGDANHTDVAAAGPITVAIRRPFVEAGAPVWENSRTTVVLTPFGVELDACTVWAARYGEAGAEVARATLSGSAAAFSKDLTGQTGWTLFFLGAGLAPVCRSVPLN